MKRRFKMGFLNIFLIVLVLVGGCSSDVTNTYTAAPVQYEGFCGKVSYLGPEGTYTEEATRLFFGTEGEYMPQKTVAEAVKQLEDGNSAYAVIPQENTIGGPVYDYMDIILDREGISIVGEVELPIRQALLTTEGTGAEDIKVVYSHQQGILQGMGWIEQHLPGAEVVEVSSTAEGARIVSESDSRNCAAIASVGAAKVYGLCVLAEGIQQNEDNKTRFYILSAEEAYKGENDRMVFAATGKAEDLPKLLKEISKNDLELVSIHDRPEKTILGNYIYLIEVKNGSYGEYERIKGLPEFEFRYYGAFPVK